MNGAANGRVCQDFVEQNVLIEQTKLCPSHIEDDANLNEWMRESIQLNDSYFEDDYF